MIREKTPNHRSAIDFPGFDRLPGIENAEQYQKHADDQKKKDERLK